MPPILFNTEMVRAILDGRKTVTRRVVKPQPLAKLAFISMGYKAKKWAYPSADTWKYWKDESYKLPGGLTDEDKSSYWTPPCNTDDILYVRECFAHIFGRYVYRADYGEVTEESKPFWKPSIRMPRKTARIFLRVTDVRVERLRDISLYDVWNEGTPQMPGNNAPDGAVGHEDFVYLWDSTIKPKDRTLYGWDANPWVWVIEFEKISREEATENA